jgi:hypothetical protein
MDNIQANKNANCRYCRAILTTENEFLPRIDYRETEILNLKQQIQNFKGIINSLQHDLDDKDSKL